jgi:hypothetical protein
MLFGEMRAKDIFLPLARKTAYFQGRFCLSLSVLSFNAINL